jgi:hypothetical protein
VLHKSFAGSIFMLGTQNIISHKLLWDELHLVNVTFKNHEILLQQGHITLDQAVFPERTPVFVLDVLARSSLWKIGLDYRHGILFFNKSLEENLCLHSV